MEPFRLVSDIEFEAENVEDACKKLIEIFKKIGKGEKEDYLIQAGNLEIMSLNMGDNIFEIPKKIVKK